MATKEVKTAPIKLLFDFWAEEDVRTPAGTIIDLPTDQAKALIAQGKAERADPMPGEE